MFKVSVIKDLEEAGYLWQRHWPRKCLFDLWPVRSCFQAHFNNELYFLKASGKGIFQGMLALSWIEEEGYFGHFPGEIWQGKTWLEQNKIVASDSDTIRALIDNIPSPAFIRYLENNLYESEACPVDADEVGYLFLPGQYNYSFHDYRNCFSSKSRRKMRHEMDRLTALGVSFRYDQPADLDMMFSLNMENYKQYSYFNDPRFLRSFEKLASWLHANNLLRVTTVLIGGRVAAVDMGAVWNSTYTVLAGGTHPDFPGVAKLINFHHIEWACLQRLFVVDFLCGEFNWKNRFHLTPRPLYRLRSQDSAPDLRQVELGRPATL